MRTEPDLQAFPKGTKGGTCNRTACNTVGAYWYMSGTQNYYCDRCATLINYYSQIDVHRDICKKEKK